MKTTQIPQQVIRAYAYSTITVVTRSGTRHVVLFDHGDAEMIGRHRWHISNGIPTSETAGAMPRIIAAAAGKLAPGDAVVQVNRNRLDCRRENLVALPRKLINPFLYGNVTAP